MFGLEKKKEKNKKLKAEVKLIGAFWFKVIETLKIDSRTIKRGETRIECGYQSATRCSNSLHMHLGSSGVLTPLKMLFVKIC